MKNDTYYAYLLVYLVFINLHQELGCSSVALSMVGGKQPQMFILLGQNKLTLNSIKSSARSLLELIFGQTLKERMLNMVLFSLRLSIC
jgi:hypothetical protein